MTEDVDCNEQHAQTSDNIKHEQHDEEQSETDEQMVQLDDTSEGSGDIIQFSWTQVNKDNCHKYKDTDILLDTGSTFSVFKNHQMLLNIRNSERTLKAFTNGGRQDSNRVGDLPGFFQVWYSPDSMVNILAFCDVAKKYCITTDTSKGKFMLVHLAGGRKMKFEEVTSGLYLFRNRAHTVTGNIMSGYSYLILTQADMADFTKEQISRAQKARELYKAMGFPGYRKFLWLLSNNKVKESLVTLEDAKRALHIYGHEVAALKGKTPRRKQNKTKCADRVELPNRILK